MTSTILVVEHLKTTTEIIDCSLKVLQSSSILIEVLQSFRSEYFQLNISNS